MARSRLTFDPSVSEPRFVRRSVSGDTPATKEVDVNEVTVKQVPFMDMESPRWASERRKASQVMVRVVPSVSWRDSWETAGCGQVI